jgi:hypothetical protein
LPVEVFCQNKCPFAQQANLQFLIEGRLLKIAGKKFKQDIIKLKEEGIKTEPAFGKILRLEKPYEDLLTLQSYSDQELKKYLYERIKYE